MWFSINLKLFAVCSIVMIFLKPFCFSQWDLRNSSKVSKHFVADDPTSSEKSLAQSWGRIQYIRCLAFSSDSAGPVIWDCSPWERPWLRRSFQPIRRLVMGQLTNEEREQGLVWHADSPQPLTWQLQDPPESREWSPPTSRAESWAGRGLRRPRESLLVSVILLCEDGILDPDPNICTLNHLIGWPHFRVSFVSGHNLIYIRSSEPHLSAHHGSQKDQQGTEGHQQRSPGPVLSGTSGRWSFPLAGRILPNWRKSLQKCY